MLFPRGLSFHGRYTFKRQLWAEMLIAAGTQTALLGQFVLARMFDPSAADITWLFTLLHVTFAISPWLSEQMRTRPTRTLTLMMIVLGPGAFLMGAVTKGYWGIGPLLAIANLVFISMFVPLRNRLMRANYRDDEKGTCYGTFSMWNQLAYFGLILGAALALERNVRHIHWMLPVVGVLSGIGLWMFGRIRVRHEQRHLREARRKRSRRSPLAVYANMVRLFRDDPRFFRYELGFLLYGFGFMVTMPREIDAVSKVLAPSYTVIVIALFGVTPLARVAVARWFGRILDQRGPYYTAAISYACLALYPALIWATVAAESLTLWFAARVAFGVAMAGVDLAWNIGPTCFGAADRAEAYSAAHVFNVAIRASAGPALGLFVAGIAGSGVFVLGVAFMLAGAAFMAWLERRDQVPDATTGS